jgi:hypothetical protein
MGLARTSVKRTDGGDSTGRTGTPTGRDEEEDEDEDEEDEDEEAEAKEAKESKEDEEAKEAKESKEDEEAREDEEAEETEAVEAEEDEDTGGAGRIGPRNPGVPNIGGPSSNPSASVAVFHAAGTVPGDHGSVRSMLAFASSDGFAPAMGAPTPSSISSMSAPDASRRRRSNWVFGRLMPVVTIAGSAERRDADAWLFAITIAEPDPSDRSGSRARRVSAPAFTDAIVQPLRLRGSEVAPVENAAISIHSSAVERFDPIHIASDTTMRTGTGGGEGSASGSDAVGTASTAPVAVGNATSTAPEPTSIDAPVPMTGRRTEPVSAGESMESGSDAAGGCGGSSDTGTSASANAGKD